MRAKLILGEFNIQKITNKCPTFKKHAGLWMGLPHDWRESTKASYQLNLDKHILPVFGKMRVDAIARKDVKVFYDKLMSDGKATNTVRVIRAALSGVLTHAVDSEIIDINPAAGLQLPKKKSGLKIKPLKEKEVEQLLEAAKGFLDDYYYPHLLCALRTEMRLGEMRALKWTDIGFKKRMIEVRRSCRLYDIASTKTDKRRQVDMTPLLAATLTLLETRQKKAALRGGSPMPEWVFSNNRGKMFCRMPYQNALNRCL